ncbi:MAG: EAL domain-containing protein [Gammaproteobacteria bacterium]|nr:EAL domain-containing protein [Gammaproteobacteria bacterium]
MTIVAGTKQLTYWLTAIALTVGYLLVNQLNWHGSVASHSLMENGGTLLILMAGIVALLRYYSRPDPSFLILGAGFIGTAALDVFHAVISSGIVSINLSYAASWSGFTARLFLSVVFLFSYIAWKASYFNYDLEPPSAKRVYVYTAVATIATFILFSFVPLPPAYLPDFALHRPYELLPVIIFAIALWGHLQKAKWREDSFEHWIIIAIIVNIICQLAFLFRADQLYDATHMTAHIFKQLGYIAILIGLFIIIFQSFKRVELMAQYDVLTNLPNRVLFADRFLQAMAHSNRNELMLGVCFLDLDNFKPINDRYGHKTGDQLLIQVAERIKKQIRDGDTVSRHGGDEFCLLLSDVRSIPHCEQMLERIHSTLAQSFIIDDTVINISASIGISLYPNDDADLDTLLRHADQAMYQAKLAGRNRYRIYNAADDQEIAKRHLHLQEVRQALLHNELTLYYQPKVNMLTGKVYGFEALIRWMHPKRGMIPPLDFLPLIEDTDVEIQIGQWVIEHALYQLNQWQQKDLQLEVSINISSYHLQSPSFLTHLEAVLAEYKHVNAHLLQLEILESSALNDLNAINDILNTCRNDFGIQIALDDFGTGYSSLTHLRNLPVDTIKLDQSFVRDILDDPNDYSIIEGMIGLTNAFNRNAIAEGVETTEHGLMLLAMDCVLAQGYGISRPMPANDVTAWLEHYQLNDVWVKYAQQRASMTQKQKDSDVFKLILEQWYSRVQTKTMSLPADTSVNWPILDKNKCPMGVWLYRRSDDSVFDQKTMTELNNAHALLHLIAQDLVINYESGDVSSAKQSLSKLATIVEALKNILQQAK